MNIAIKEIMFDTKKSLHKKLEEIYKELVFIIHGDEILKNQIHIYDGEIDMYDFTNKVIMSFISAEMVARQELNRPMDCNIVDEALIQKIYEKGLTGVIFLSCKVCKSQIGARYTLDFVNGEMNIVYSEEYSNRYNTMMSQYPDISIGTEESSCRDMANQTEFEFNFKCTSGKIVVANILDRNVPKFAQLKKSFSINEKKGLIDMMRYWESHNFLYMQCGNTSPSILQNSKGEILIGSYYDDEVDADYSSNPDEYNTHISEDYKEVGYVCTDLWAVHIIDYDDFKDYEKDCDVDYTIVDISQLGTDIIVKYHYDFQSWDLDSSQILLTMKAK